MSVCNQNSETGGKKSELRRQKLKLKKSEADRVLGNDINVGPQWRHYNSNCCRKTILQRFYSFLKCGNYSKLLFKFVI